MRVRLLGAVAAFAAALGGVAGAAPSAQPGPGQLLRGPIHVMWPRPAGVDGRSQNAPMPGPNQLSFNGGQSGIGIQTQPAVYLVFWGSQWSRTDPYVSYEERFLRGLYGRGDDWTRVGMQYCQGIASGAVDCTRRNPHVGAPRGGLLKGVWFDDSSFAVPTDVEKGSSLDTVATEAARAAQHFGNTTQAANRNVQYVINEPSHFDSPTFLVYCAYHGTVTSSNYGLMSYTALPYMLDSGTDCGQNDVNAGAAGTYDGLSIIEGHEFMEALTDPITGAGWLDANGNETADKCEWLTTGPGAMGDLHLATGTFAVQGTWSDLANNGAGGCVTHLR